MVGGSWGVAGRCRRLRKQTRTNRVHLFLPIIFACAPTCTNKPGGRAEMLASDGKYSMAEFIPHGAP